MTKTITIENNDVNSVTGELLLFRTPYINPPRRNPITFSQPSRTKQEFANECDINQIVANFLKTGRLDTLQNARSMYVDLANAPQSYHESLDLVIRSGEAFQALPSDIRAKFNNDVSQFLEAAYHNPEAVFGPVKASDAPQPVQATQVAQPPVNPPAAPPQPQTATVAS